MAYVPPDDEPRFNYFCVALGVLGLPTGLYIGFCLTTSLGARYHGNYEHYMLGGAAWVGKALTFGAAALGVVAPIAIGLISWFIRRGRDE